MDFLEGFLLGPIWSDTEYETRHHTGFYWLVGWLVLLAFIWFILFPERTAPWTPLSLLLSMTILLLLLLASPFLCRYYYRFNIAYKIPVIGLQIVKYSLVLYSSVLYATGFLSVSRAELPQDAVEYVNLTMARTALFFESWGRGLGMILGIISGGFLLVVTLIGSILLASVIPSIILFLARLLQRLLDYVVYRYVYREAD